MKKTGNPSDMPNYWRNAVLVLIVVLVICGGLAAILDPNLPPHFNL